VSSLGGGAKGPPGWPFDIPAPPQAGPVADGLGAVTTGWGAVAGAAVSGVAAGAAGCAFGACGASWIGSLPGIPSATLFHPAPPEGTSATFGS